MSEYRRTEYHGQPPTTDQLEKDRYTHDDIVWEIVKYCLVRSLVYGILASNRQVN